MLLLATSSSFIDVRDILGHEALLDLALKLGPVVLVCSFVDKFYDIVG
jgi:hypothetical protein